MYNAFKLEVLLVRLVAFAEGEQPGRAMGKNRLLEKDCYREE